MTERSPHQLPGTWLALTCFGLAMTLGVIVARAIVTGLAQSVGTVAALPAGVLAFVVVSAVALVLTARLDAARRG